MGGGVGKDDQNMTKTPGLPLISPVVWCIGKGCPWEVWGSIFENHLVWLGTCARLEELSRWTFCPSQAHRGAVSLLTLVEPGLYKEQRHFQSCEKKPEQPRLSTHAHQSRAAGIQASPRLLLSGGLGCRTILSPPALALEQNGSGWNAP